TQNAPPSRLPTLFLLSASMRPRDLRIAAEACLWRTFSPRLLVPRVLALAPRPAPPAPLAATGPAASRPTATGPTADPSRPGHLVRTPVSTAPLTPAESALL